VPLVTLPSPKQLLARFDLQPKNSFGQNFLSDPRLAGKIADLATPERGLRVLELGAGLGALTHELLAREHQVTAVERDRDLVPALNEIFADAVEAGSLTVLEADAKTLDWESAVARSVMEPGKLPVITGNLPYQITGPLVEKTVHLGRKIQRAVYLVQKEVAERLAAPAGSKTYGALSVFVQAQFRVERAFVIKAGAFHPQPRVDSAVVVLLPHAIPISEETPTFRKVVKSAFSARRKTLRNAWKGLLPAEQLDRVASLAGISLDLRGETLTVEQFARFAALVEKTVTEEGGSETR
jgi:16S rRNA (adenine1518-N6/adenine1519-N6)-dimethyltransferase